ncbi:MAG: prephenate dehydrogenase [Chloroflexota bacterium]
MAKITIIGLGLIGGSLGMALRQVNKSYEVVGHDKNPEAGPKAKRRGAIDKAEWNLPKAVEGASLVVVATPAGTVESVFNDIAPYLSPGCTVTDTVSTKAHAMDLAARILPGSVNFVGGHPMAGKELSGVEEAEATLFQDCTYCIVPSPTASDDAVSLVVGMAHSVGAETMFIDAVEHDSYVAAVSHLPFLAATALVRTAGTSIGWRDIAKVAAGGFRDTTRMASGNTEMYRDICLTNREFILRWLDNYLGEVHHLRELLAKTDPAGMEEVFAEAKSIRDEWVLTHGNPRTPAPAEVPMEKGDQLRHMLLGRWGGGGEDKEKKR